MRKTYYLLGFFLAIASSANALERGSLPVLAPLPEQAQAAHLSAQFLARYGYKPVALDDALSAKIMDHFIKSLDPDRMIFLQADIDKFMADRAGLDDAIQQEDLRIPFSIFDTYQRRFVDRMNYSRSLLKQNFNFDTKEDY